MGGPPVLIAGEQSETGVQPMKESLMEALAAGRSLSRMPVRAAPPIWSAFLGLDPPFGGCEAIVSGSEEERAELRQARPPARRSVLGEAAGIRLLHRGGDAGGGARPCRGRAAQARDPLRFRRQSDGRRLAGRHPRRPGAHRPKRRQRALVAAIFDPAAVLACEAAGAGGIAELRLGRLNRKTPRLRRCCSRAAVIEPAP